MGKHNVTPTNRREIRHEHEYTQRHVDGGDDTFTDAIDERIAEIVPGMMIELFAVAEVKKAFDDAVRAAVHRIVTGILNT